MNILLVDDEQHVREAIKLLVDWDTLGVERIIEAENGALAIELAKQYRPAIIITDMMMPIVGGVDLLAWIHEHLPAARTIVISGHDDFDLVRNTMKYGGLDYILKPIDPDVLGEALKKAKLSWEQEQSDRLYQNLQKIEMNQLKPVYWDKLFSNLISDANYYHSVKDVLGNEFQLSKEGTPQCQIIIIGLEFIERKVTEKFNNHRDLLFFALTNICNELLRSRNSGYACRYWNSESEIVIFYWNQFQDLHFLLAEINNSFYRTLRGRFDFGAGLVHSFPEGLKQSYDEAKSALRQRNMLQNMTWLHLYEPSGVRTDANINKLHLSDYEEPFRMALLSSSEAEICAAVLEWLEAVKGLPAISLEQVELWRHEFTVLRSQWAKLLTGDANGISPAELPNLVLPVPLDDQGRLSLPLWQTELCDVLTKYSEALTSSRQKDRSPIMEIVKYIEQHYNHGITLQDIASRFHLSREYISRKFKQETGGNLSDFLERIRIDKAKMLLQNPHLKIIQIAEMVGYPDEKYFSKVFKKSTGCSPGQYRKSAQ
ncbi:HTH-type transcriptional activator RhaR [Paenibacillus plantiphilus]|uniref:HTH-type transcriptional activator RhaR n=1 Tax=Paenibacillus plantiphilus TaxID=2905650 RepID=A0ABN8H2P2_9BACL|nr:helix-turn-helix domain-containing protein [Paenibacillus plantiphilus]CAH1225635.1 HTH-type transcriptional activator RhaR [Paenibacillus plantiphilus]